jgi:hypothetical protein
MDPKGLSATGRRMLTRENQGDFYRFFSVPAQFQKKALRTPSSATNYLLDDLEMMIEPFGDP